MNRLPIPQPSHSDLSAWHTQPDPARSAFAEPAACHTLFCPLHYEPKHAYPLVVWLHGPGDNEKQLKRIMPLLSMRNFVAVGPRGTKAVDPDDPDGRGYGWSQESDHQFLAEQRVLESIDAATERFNIAPQRVFLAGLHCGGTMAFRLAMDYPERFAGVLSLGGPFPRAAAPLRRIEESRRIPLFLATSQASHGYPPEQVCADLRLFYVAGMSVTLRQYPCGDEVTTQMLTDMNHWIMEQACSPVAAPRNATGRPGG